jgi:hypothetical protein
MMFVSRRNSGICLLALALTLALVGAGWAQTPKPASPEQANAYGRAVALLEQAQQQLTAGNLPPAQAMMKQSNDLFTLLQKEHASVLAERQLSPNDDQQLAINQKLAGDAQAQADRMMETAAAREKQARELKAQGKTEATEAAYRESREGYLQAQNLSIKSAIYALRNQQIIFRFLAP